VPHQQAFACRNRCFLWTDFAFREFLLCHTLAAHDRGTRHWRTKSTRQQSLDCSGPFTNGRGSETWWRGDQVWEKLAQFCRDTMCLDISRLLLIALPEPSLNAVRQLFE
jgi:hypothetical protein